MVEVNRRSVSERDRPGSWSGIIHDFFGESNVSVREQDRFCAEVVHSEFGNLQISKITSSSEFTERTTRHVKRDARDNFVLVNVRKGVVRLKQRARDCEILSGAFALFDLNSPWTWQHPQQTEIINVTVPGAMLRARLRTLDRLVCAPKSANSGLWKVASDLVTSLTEQLPHLHPSAGFGYGGHLVELIAVALEADETDALEAGNASVRTILHRRCVGFIRANLADPTLDPETISSAMGISVRYLHRIFQDAGQSVCAALRDLRLHAAHRALADPATLRIPVSEIALRCGFKSQAHFAVAFKAKYGLPATEWRRQARHLIKLTGFAA